MSYMLNFQNKIAINCVVMQLQLPDEIRSGKDMEYSTLQA